jgi:hypothetical protein
VTTTLEDLIPADAIMRVQVLDDPETREKGRKAIAMSDVLYACPTSDIAASLIEALRVSDEKLRGLHDSLMLWEWNSTWLEQHPDGSSSALLRVAWYDREFYDERKSAWLGKMHRRIYEEIGIGLDDMSVTHWLLDEAA